MTVNLEDVDIEAVNGGNKSEYEDFIFSRTDTTFTDTWAWRELVEKVYGLRHYWYLARKCGKIEGILTLTFSEHPLFGRYLSTAPYANQGGFYANSEGVSHALLKKARNLQLELNAQYTIIRSFAGKFGTADGWQEDGSYATYHLPLQSNIDEMMKKNLKSKDRNKVSKSTKFGSNVVFGRTELLDDFWHVISHSMKELGTPYHSKHYLLTLLNTFGGLAEFAVAYTKDGDPIGGSLLLQHADTLVHLHANTLKKYRSIRVGDFLYRSVIEECCRRGLRYFDMGRSLVGSGNEQFKMKWHPERRPLVYLYNLSEGFERPQLNQNNPKYKLLIGAWRRMPFWFLHSLGPQLIKGIL